jgi:hypothetical protein
MHTRLTPILLLMLTLAGAVWAQTKLSGELKCEKAEPVYALAVGDRPDHTFSIGKIKCTSAKPFVIEGLKFVSEDVTSFTEVTGDRFRAQGRNVGTMSNGDKYYVSTQVSGTGKVDAFRSAEVRWTYNGGTGTLKGLTGKGTSKCKGAADGSSICVVEGEYQLKK